MATPIAYLVRLPRTVHVSLLAMTSLNPEADFPHPFVAVDVVLLTISDGAVRVLLVERPDSEIAGWGLPGAYLQLDERIAGTRARVLADKCGVTGITEGAYRPLTPRDALDRDPRRRTISLVSWAPVHEGSVRKLRAGAALAEVKPTTRGLRIHLGNRALQPAVDHAEMITEAALALAGEVDHLAPAAGAVPELLPDTFSTRDVEAVLTLAGALDGRGAPDTNALRRRLTTVTDATGDVETLAPGQRHRPAELRRWSR